MLELDRHPEELRGKLGKFGRQIQNKVASAARILEQRGEARGIQIGEEKGRIETARRLLSMRIPMRTIAQAALSHNLFRI